MVRRFLSTLLATEQFVEGMIDDRFVVGRQSLPKLFVRFAIISRGLEHFNVAKVVLDAKECRPGWHVLHQGIGDAGAKCALGQTVRAIPIDDLDG